MGIFELTKIKSESCECGKTHINPIGEILVGSGVIKELGAVLSKMGIKKPFVLSDINTYRAAGEYVCRVLTESGIAYKSYVLDEEMPEPDEKTVGSAVMNYDPSCDAVIAVGSGVINDT